MALTFPLGAGYVASYAKKVLGTGYNVELFKFQDKLHDSIKNNSPHILALSNYCWNLELGYTLMKWVKSINPYTVTIMGGPNFPTDRAEKISFLKKRHLLDFYIESEGEIGFVNLIKELEKYDFNCHLLKRNFVPITNCTYMYENDLVEAKVERIRDVNEIPSPYLNGTFDELFNFPLIPMIETTRGCPFACTFCADGISFKNKVFSYNTHRVKEELKYIYDRVKNVDELRFSDLNFGMYKQDEETAGYVAELQAEFGWPKLIRASLGKNRPDRIIRIADTLNGTLVMGAAQQSSNEEVLRNVKRSNISGEAYRELLDYMNKTSDTAKTFSEFILGLPGDSKEKHFLSLKHGIDNNVNTIRMFQAILLTGTEMATPKVRGDFEFKTKHRVISGAIGKYEFGDQTIPITEIEEIVVGNKDLTFEDYISCRIMNLIVETFHNNALFDEYFSSLRKLGISEFDCLVYIYEHNELYTPKIQEVVSSFIKATTEALYDNREEALKLSIKPERFERHLSGEIGSLELVEHKAKLYFELQDLIKIVSEVAKVMMKDKGIFTETLEDYFQQLGDYIFYAKCNITNPDLKFIQNFSYNWREILKNKFLSLPDGLNKSKKFTYRFFHDSNQKALIKNALSLHANHENGAPMIYQQNLKLLYRKCELVNSRN